MKYTDIERAHTLRKEKIEKMAQLRSVLGSTSMTVRIADRHLHFSPLSCARFPELRAAVVEALRSELQAINQNLHDLGIEL